MVKKIYDVIILGGGIAGINTTYQLIKRNRNLSILLLEASDRFGGRIHTIPKYGLEAGAGRFSNRHKHLLKLIRELGLEKKMAKSSASAEYFPIEKTNTKSQSFFLSTAIEIYTGKPVNHLTEIIAKVVIASNLERREYLQSISFVNYAKTILTKEEVIYMKNSFGYYSELVIMNAHDTIELIKNLDPSNTFYTLQGGLSQIIDEMINRIKNMNPKESILKKNHQVTKIKREKENDNDTDPFYSLECENGKEFHTNKIIAALPKQIIEQITFFKSLKPDLKKIECAPLCRIYSKFKDTKWLQELPKFTTNNNLRMVIPINREKGTIMISYTDNKFAEYWQNLYKKEGIQKVDEKIAEYIKQSTNLQIPKPTETMIYYWHCGVGYWGVGADSHTISQKMVKPFQQEEVYICGEHYSERNQQWIEGALETSNFVLKQI